METYTPDALIAGDSKRIVDTVTLITGQNLTRGALLGKITASGKYMLCDSAAVDGSEDPVYVLAEDCDASAADVVCEVYLSGEFSEGAMTFGGADDADTHRAALRDLNIYLRKTEAA